MKYLCLVYMDEKTLDAVPTASAWPTATSLRKSGHCIAAEALQSVQTATTVRVRNGKVSITDGPFAETKEQLAGFYLIDARDLERGHPDGREDPAGARGEHRGAAGQGIIGDAGSSKRVNTKRRDP